MKTLYYKKTALIALTSIIIVSFLTHPAIAQIVNCIDFKPNTLNINSCGKWATVYIELDGYNPEEINIETILLNGQVAPVLDPSCYLVDVTCEPGVNERMIKFKRDEVDAILSLGAEIEVTITGELYDGTNFVGTDLIRVIERGECLGDFDFDNDIDGDDVTEFRNHFGRNQYNRPCTSGDPCNGDFSCDEDVDAEDLTKFLEDFGRNQYNNPCPE